MRTDEIKDIISQNSDEKLNQYLSILLDKCKDIARESNLIALFMLILIFLYYLADFSELESLQIGPIVIKNINSIKVFIPLVFAFLIFRYIIISSHKAELHKIIKRFTVDYFNYDDMSSEKIIQMDDFTRSILPFSIYSEINKLSYKGKSKFGCLGAILILPITLIAFIPFILEYYWIKEFIIQFNCLNFTQKSSVVMSIWILVISIYYTIHTMIIGIKEGN